MEETLEELCGYIQKITKDGSSEELQLLPELVNALANLSNADKIPRSELEATLSIDTDGVSEKINGFKEELNNLEEQADRIIKKTKFVEKEQNGGN